MTGRSLYLVSNWPNRSQNLGYHSKFFPPCSWNNRTFCFLWQFFLSSLTSWITYPKAPKSSLHLLPHSLFHLIPSMCWWLSNLYLFPSFLSLYPYTERSTLHRNNYQIAKTPLLQLRANAEDLLQKTLVQLEAPALGRSQLAITLAPGNPMSSSGLREHPHTCTQVHTYTKFHSYQ